MMTTTHETNGFGFNEQLPLSIAQDSLECVRRIQERVSRRTAVLQEILQRFSQGTEPTDKLSEGEATAKSQSPMHKKRQLLPLVEWLKDRVLREQLHRASTGRLQELFRRAADEAAVLAFGTDFPLLVLPVLVQERCGQVMR